MIHELQNALRNAKHVGDLVMWRAGGNVKPDALRAALDDNGLTEIEAPTISPETAWSAAIRDAANSNGLEAKLIRNDPGTIAYAFVDLDLNGDVRVGDKTGRVVNRLAWLKAIPESMADQVDPTYPVLLDSEDDTVAETVRARWEHRARNLSARAIREVIVGSLMSWGAVRMQRSGMYFLPASRAEVVRQLRSAMSAVGTTIFLMPLPDVEDSKAALGEAAREQVSSKIADLRKEAQRWRDNSRNPRAGTLEDRLESYRALKDELTDVVDILAIESEDLAGEIDALVSDCQVMLGIDSEPDEEPEPGNGNGQSAEPVEADIEAEVDEEAPEPPARRPAAPGRPSPFAGMKVEELRREARRLGIRTTGLKKDGLIAALDARVN
jgi:hypothetical protein